MLQSSERPILMFIHGVGGSAETWNSQIKYFTDLGYSVVAPDLLGHGFSSAPDKIAMYKFKHLLEDMVAVFQHFFQNTKHRVVLVGHSYGALFATCLALQFPSRVSVLCLISSGGPYPPPRSSKTGLLSLPSWALDLLKPCLLAKARRSLLYASHTKRVSLSQAFDIPSHVLHHVVHGQELPENSGDALLFRRLSLPTLLVHGMRDPLVSLVEACEMERRRNVYCWPEWALSSISSKDPSKGSLMKRAILEVLVRNGTLPDLPGEVIPRAHLEVIPEAGHMCMLDTPSELNRLLLKFLIKWRRLMTPLPSAHHIHSSAVMPT
ncbi:unnamed protein product [Darwinula stevensoni]|uniref:acylglycerol lipase n=1 Tax=Darwinula stevensoni TaxID=69355 RepID=A0A7R9FNH0_9CRUS|nr:unnamed protein product [Darwinula stevensoni]CAG0896672.1 unnamed protein product [Darwinula stevensoni]